MRRPSAGAVEAVPGTPMEALRMHWRLYVYEGAELGWFMVAACFAAVVLFGGASPVVREIPSAVWRRVLMGVAMGGTAVMIIHSPMGKRSGAHFNPAITLSYLRLGKIGVWDAVGYVVGQFVGAVVGVGLSAAVLGRWLAQPGVEFVVTVPGVGGTAGAFAAEWGMSVVLMGVVLWLTNRPRLAHYTSYTVGALIVVYVFLFAPVSGFSMNPARTVGSAVFAGVWTAVWVYFAAPLLGMVGAAEVYWRRFGRESVMCAKLHPDPSVLCPFDCSYPGHRHVVEVTVSLHH
ncbi:MAG: aquaporin family protein [Acidobacteria bacterium]|nr:aquaporin family protein [Acidobacteriota bacterium]